MVLGDNQTVLVSDGKTVPYAYASSFSAITRSVGIEQKRHVVGFDTVSFRLDMLEILY